MKFPQPILFCIKSAPLRKVLLPIALMFCLFNLYAQENNLKLAIETGILPFRKSNSNGTAYSGNLGIFIYFEPKMKVMKSAFLGLRFGVTLNAQDFENNENYEFIIDEQSDNGVMSFVPTFDYYLKESNHGPYLGLGVGYYLLSDMDVSKNHVVDPSEDKLEVSVKNQVGLLLRGGFESYKWRFGLEYSFIPRSDIVIPNERIIGTVGSSYFALSVGFVIGGGKVIKD